MDFDLSHIHVPFRMQPGLRRLAAGDPQLTRLDPAQPLYGEKRRVYEAGQSRQSVPGFDPGPALAAIARECPAPPGLPPELAYEEDLAVLDGATGTLPWLCVCVPSHWAPEDKLGLPFAQVHAPVADSATLIAASSHLVQLATSGQRWERWVWTLTPSARYDQHPRRHPRTPWPVAAEDGSGDDALARQCRLRAERQTFFPVGPGSGQAVFTIRVTLMPLAEAIGTGAEAQRLHDSLASMTDAVLAYKSLAPARDPLMRWLRRRMDASPA